ncbi:MAG: SIR2 family protein [Microscillaceae bacterium]|nr:SIR2 family protein [Microscillaceae bacterium]
MDWEALKDSILDGQTILFLGQGMTYNYQKPQNEFLVFEQIAQELGENALALHQKDGLFILKNAKKRQLVAKLKAFYEQDFSNPLLEKLAEIPFHLIVHITPDISLKKVFESKSFPFEHAYYKLHKKEVLTEPTPSKPLIYHLFGCVEGGKDDLYIEHTDLFNYVRSIYNPHSAPPEVIMSHFTKEKTDTIVFLGCDFDKWYFQLILHLLKIDEIKSSNTSLIQKDFYSDWKQVFEEGFQVKFIDDDLEEFVNTLYACFEPSELRKAAEKPDFDIKAFKEKLQTEVDQGEYNKVFAEIDDHTAHLMYDQHLFNRLRSEMSFKITLDLIQQLKTFITTLQYKA